MAAPTGSGKTACAEFAVLRMIQRAAAEKGAARCVYIAPLPALGKERLADWTAKVREGLVSRVSRGRNPIRIIKARDYYDCRNLLSTLNKACQVRVLWRGPPGFGVASRGLLL